MVTKAFLGSPCPLKASFLHAFGQGSLDEPKVFDELVVERGQPMKASHFRDGGGSRPTLDSLNFRFINWNSLSRHDIVKKDNLRSE